MRVVLYFLLSLVLTRCTCQKQTPPAPEVTPTAPISERTDYELGNPMAPKGGTFRIGMPAYPKSLLYYLAFDEFSLMINNLTLETLVDAHPKTNELIPLLAKKWEVSADRKTFTFHLDPKARFSDGKPVTSADVVFTWKTILDPRNKTLPIRAALASFKSCKALDKLTVQFKAKGLHFKNLEKAGGLFVLPKHFYSKGNFNKAYNRKLLGSGPYVLHKLTRGKRIVLKRDPKHWSKDFKQNVGKYNFDKLDFITISDYTVQYEKFKRGDLDYFYFLVAKMWATQTNGPLFKKGLIKKLKVENTYPGMTQGIFWNLRKPLFKDKRVRKALSHLMHVAEWNRDLFYGQYHRATGVVSRTSEYHPPGLEPIKFNKTEARRLLNEAGWTKTNKDGLLERNGLAFEFDMISDNPSSGRFLTRFQRDLKLMGIKMNIRQMDWTTALKHMDDRKFDAKMSARGRGIDPSDFYVGWGSKEADKVGSANVTGYKNPVVDKLAKEIDEIFDKKKRLPKVQKLVRILAEDQPVSFAWELHYIRVAHWDRFGYPGKGYFPYAGWGNLFNYWWYDSAKAARVDRALKR